MTRTVLLGRALREHGVAVTPAEVVVAAAALQIIDQDDREEVFLTLRSIFTSRVDDFPIFEQLFAQYWDSTPEKHVQREGLSKTTLQVRPGAPRRGLAYFLENWATARSEDSEPMKVPGASESESASEKDFTSFDKDDLDEVARLARRIVKRLAKNPSRRWRSVRRGSRINLRRSLRDSLKTGGEVIALSFKERKPKRTKLVVICDVSGSMDIYSRLLLQFIYGLQNSFAKV